jgi:hypothetical protein
VRKNTEKSKKSEKCEKYDHYKKCSISLRIQNILIKLVILIKNMMIKVHDQLKKIGTEIGLLLGTRLQLRSTFGGSPQI